MRQPLVLLLGFIVLVGCAVTSQSETPVDQTGVPTQEASSVVPEQSGCLWTHPLKEQDPPVGELLPAGEPLGRDDMRMRPGFLGRLLVPEAWVVEHDGQCTETQSIMWVNPLNERERVAHRVG
ncbi:MAG: hypothetical protein QF419_03835, partial [Acidimicrobiales bacterium]|nr:hypothetical protein [Acidimicrobiales bacterium]